MGSGRPLLPNPLPREGGQGTVEFALTLIMFILLVMGVVDFARAFFTQETLQQAATEGGRAASVNQCRDTINNPPTGTKSIDYAIFKSLFGLDWSRTTVTVSYENITPTVGRQLTVTVIYQFNVATPIVGGIITAGLGSTPTLTGIATATVEQASTSC